MEKIFELVQFLRSLFWPIKQSINNLLLFLNVRFIEWFPFYQQIRTEFGYSTEKDQKAAEMLSQYDKGQGITGV